MTAMHIAHQLGIADDRHIRGRSVHGLQRHRALRAGANRDQLATSPLLDQAQNHNSFHAFDHVEVECSVERLRIGQEKVREKPSWFVHKASELFVRLQRELPHVPFSTRGIQKGHGNQNRIAAIRIVGCDATALL